MTWNFDENVVREGTDRIKYDLRKEIFGEKDVIPMWVADMDFRTPDFIIEALRSRLAHEICSGKNILIISDEIHCDLVLPGFIHTCLAGISEEIADRTITCIAPGKTFNLAGLSTSSVIIPNAGLRKSFNRIIDGLHLGNGNLFGTIASVAAYTYGYDWVKELIDYVDRNVDYVIDYCRKMIPEIIPVQPEATYMIWLDCGKLGMNGKELQKFFTQSAGVGINEGSGFGPGGEGFIRMNLATTRNLVIRAMEQIGKAVSSIR